MSWYLSRKPWDEVLRIPGFRSTSPLGLRNLKMWYWLVPLILVVIGLAFFFLKANPKKELERARTLFQQQRSQLGTLFLQTAGAAGKPRGLRWTECQWSELIEWVRDKQTGQLMALVGVTISFEAIEGGDMEGLEAVGNLRNASAVFFYDGEWKTAGRTVFNLNPSEVV